MLPLMEVSVKGRSKRGVHQEGHANDGHSRPAALNVRHINLKQFVTADHSMRKIPPLIDTARLRQLYQPLFLDLLGGDLPDVTSERALVRELTGHLVLRWFMGLDLDQPPWDHSTFSQNRKRRFTKSGCSNGCLMKPWRWRSSRSWSPIIRP